MFRIAACFMLLAITVTNAFADDDVSTDISDKQPLPKSYVIEVTRLVMKESTDSVAGLSGARLDAQIRQWQEADQIASEESLSLTSVENFKACVGAVRSTCGSSHRQCQFWWQQITAVKLARHGYDRSSHDHVTRRPCHCRTNLRVVDVRAQRGRRYAG